MELDLTGQLELSAAAAALSTPSEVVDENGAELSLELSLGGICGAEVGSRKRVRVSDRAVEGKKPKIEEILHGIINPINDMCPVPVPMPVPVPVPVPVPYKLQAMTVILQGPNGYGNPCVVPCMVPFSSDDVLENSDEYKSETNRNLAVSNKDGVAAVGLDSPAGSNDHLSSISGDSSSIFSNSQREEPKKHLTDCTGSDPLRATRIMRTTVSTRSSDGKKINGHLYLGSKKEVICIICDCHGTFFSPAGFVRHAGGPETQHPLRHITVLNSFMN